MDLAEDIAVARLKQGQRNPFLSQGPGPAISTIGGLPPQPVSDEPSFFRDVVMKSLADLAGAGVGAVENAASLATSGVALPVAGLAGIGGNLLGGPEQGAQTVAKVMDTLKLGSK